MTDPAVTCLPNSGYPLYDRGEKLNVWLKGMGRRALVLCGLVDRKSVV